MFADLTLFRSAMALARHAGAAQAASAQNMANSDTPGYRAVRVQSFAETLAEDSVGSQRATRAGHLFGGDRNADPAFETERGKADPNGNAVSLEREMVAANAAQRDHSRALEIYRSGLSLIRAALSKG